MIIDKQPLPNDPTPADAPPSYDTVGRANQSYLPEKSGQLFDHSVPYSSSSSPISPRTPLSPSSLGSSSTSTSLSSSKRKGKARAPNWFNFSTSARTTREVRVTVLGLVRDLIQEHISNSPAATGILQSCSDACAAHSLSLSAILQEKSIENHTPLYWAIVKRLPDEHQNVEASQCPDLLTALISYASPLNEETITEVRLACLATSDQKLFQRLRLSPEFAPISGVDQMLLGGRIPPDDIEVEDVSSDGGAFVVNFVIPQFHKRMVVSKEIVLEFIARSRMWRLAFFIAPEPKVPGIDPRVGSWCISLSLLETSPPTYVDSRLLIEEAKTNSPLESSSSTRPSSSPRSVSSRRFRLASNGPKPKPTISLRLKSSEQLEVPGKHRLGRRIVVSLEDSLMGANLQYGSNPYIGPDERLRGRLEARLGKADTECIIC